MIEWLDGRLLVNNLVNLYLMGDKVFDV